MAKTSAKSNEDAISRRAAPRGINLLVGAKRIQTRRSGVHGKGVFAVQDIAEGETLIEYVGEIISWPEAQARHPHDPKDPNHTFYFSLESGNVIDALFGGNRSEEHTSELQSRP